MNDLNNTLGNYLNKAIKVAKSIDKFVNGAEKQLVLEVGNNTTKLVEYIVKDKTIEVTAGAAIGTPANAMDNDRIVNSGTLANMLKQTIKNEKIRTKEFVVSIVSKDIIIREMNVPNMQDGELKSFIKINSADIFPVNLSNYVLAYHIIERGSANRVMIAAIPKDIVDSYVELGNKLGLTLKGINYSGYELYNFLDFEIDTNNESYVAIDIGARNTNILIISRGILKFNKIVFKGSEEINKYISEDLKCSLATAEQLKRQYNTLVSVEDLPENSNENIVAKYTRRCVDGVLQDVSRITEFFNSNNPNKKVNKIYIIGPTCKLKGIEEYISKKMNIEAKALKILTKVEFDKNSMKLKARQLSFINCFGVHSLKDRHFYFINDDIKLKKISFLLKPKFHKLMICIALICAGMLTFETVKLNSLENDLATYNLYLEQKSEFRSLQKNISSKNAELANKQEGMRNLGTGMEKNTKLIDIIDDCINKLASDAAINISRYKFQNKSIEIRGRIDLPVGIDKNHLSYYEYRKIPYSLEEVIEEELQKDIDITSNSSTDYAIEFTIKCAD